jgi:hypothetical protein
MTDPVARPTFYEGEVLPAADLVATVDYARNQVARHDRFLHSWGIASGLRFRSDKAATASGTPYVNVSLLAGVAKDGTGREIVVPDDVQLNPNDFQSEVSPLADPAAWYPVFLTGLDRAALGSSGLTGTCGGSGPTRVEETYSIVYRGPGSESAVADQPLPAIADAPDDGITSSWLILLGFVQWDSNINQFHAVKTEYGPDEVQPTYVGVNAAQVVSQSGSLLLATHPAGSKGDNPVMAMQIQEAAKDGKLVFGKLNPDGNVIPVLTVAANGDLTATGKLSGAVTPGSVQVQSGMAFDGVVLPLPLGIDAKDVTDGKIALHIHASLRMDNLQPPNVAADYIPFRYECRVDTDTRQVHCQVLWRNLTALANQILLPGFCDYTVIAAVPAS